MKPITEKQLYAITQVQKTLQIKFEGKTKQDAFLWLQENVPKAKERYVIQQNAKELATIGNTAYNNNFGLRALELLDSRQVHDKETLKSDIALCHSLLSIL